MSRINDIQTNATSKIDTAKGKIDKALSGVDTLISIFENDSLLFDKSKLFGGDNFSMDASVSPFELIMEILKRTGNEDKVFDFIANMITVSLPYIEIGVKAAILSNIKGMISCDSDPMIPKSLRKLDDSTHSDDNGIFLNISGIDYSGLLQTSPMSEEGSNYYFGIHSGSSVYECARANDMNAFLWYCIHKSDTPIPSELSSNDIEQAIKEYGMHIVYDNPFGYGGDCGSTIDEMFVVEADDEKGGFIPGATLKSKDSNQMSLCVRSEYINGKLNNMFVPIGTFRNGCDWYVMEGNKVTNSVNKSSDVREYNKEYPICNIEYVDKQNSGSAVTNNAENRFKFTILPKPYNASRNIFTVKPLLFDSHGTPTKDGRYTIYGNISNGEGYISCNGYRINLTEDYDIESMAGPQGEEIVSLPETCLMECYRGLTVYEFNYDFVMGMRLFDSKVVTARLIEMLSNVRIGGTVDFSGAIINDRVIEIIRSVMEADDYTSSDCFFNFSNERYDMMMAEAEMRRYERLSRNAKANIVREVDSEKIRSILSEYDEEATLEEKVSVIKRAVTQANVEITKPTVGYDFKVGGYASFDGNEIGWDVLSQMVENIAVILCESVVTPKIILLLEVNRKLMRSDDEPLTVDSFLRMAVGLIIGIVKEIRDRILEELLKWVESELAELISKFAQAMAKEQVMGYVELIRNIKETCGSLIFGSEMASKLANVNYADIDNNIEQLTAQCE